MTTLAPTTLYSGPEYYVTVTGAGDNSGDSWANAMSLTEFEYAIEHTVVAGDVFYIAGGSYSYSSAIFTTRSGSSTNPILIIGVNSGTTNEPPIPSDYADGTNRPHITTTQGISFYDYYIVMNIRITTSVNLSVNIGSKVINCSISSSSTSSLYILPMASSSHVSDCEIISTSGGGTISGIYASYQSTVTNCYVKGCSNIGIYSYGALVSRCIINECNTGIYHHVYAAIIINNTIYNCNHGVWTDYGIMMFLNNILYSNEYGFVGDFSGANVKSIIMDYNNWYDNTYDISMDNEGSEDNTLKGPHDTSNNPLFVDYENDDFSLQSTSQCIDAGINI